MHPYKHISVLARSVFLLLLISASLPAPSAAATLRVCANGCTYQDLQSALNAAQPGDVILLRAGETFVGNFSLPAKNSGSSAYITIRSDAADASLPPAGTRLVPDTRPGGNTSRGVLARLVGRGGGWKTTPVIDAGPGAHHYLLQFLEIDGVNQEGWETLIELGHNIWPQTSVDQAPWDIVLDRVFVHGHEAKGQKRCISLNGRSVTVQNSYVSDCKNFEYDAQAIAVFNAPGPVRIVNNYIEGSGENILFGGSDPRIYGLVPSDIEILRNHITKPASWREPILSTPTPTAIGALPGAGQLGGGTHYFRIVAVLEIATDIGLSGPSAEISASVPDGSAVSLTWSGVPGADRYRVYEGTFASGQERYFETPGAETSVIFTGEGLQWGTPPATGRVWSVKNLLEFKNAQRVVVDGNVFEHIWPQAQTGYAILLTPRNQESTAPWSAVRDITLANNVLRHMSGGISILGEDDEGSSERTERITIRNNLVYDMSGQWGGDSHFLVMTRSPLNVKIDHNTIIHDGVVVLVDDGQSYGFEFTNNVTPHNAYGIFGNAAGTGTDAMAAYFPDGIVRRNAFGGGPAGQYPADNFFPSLSTFYAQFVDAGAHDYRLVSSSSFAGAATDGRNLGVDFDELGRAMQGGDNSGDIAPDPPPRGGAFGGSPVSLPGVLQAENFDEGGSGVAYADTTSGNEGGEFRATDVDIESTADAGGGYDVGWISPGEWLSYTVNVVTAGSYTFEFRVASPSDGGTFHLEVDGVNRTGTLTVPKTGGWQNWATVTTTSVSLSAGQQRWRVVFDTGAAGGGALGNFNYLRVSGAGNGGGSASSPFGGAARSLPGTVQAEDFDEGGPGVAYVDMSGGNSGGEYRSTDVDLAAAWDTGDGFCVGWTEGGESLSYSVNVATSSLYDVEIRVASSGPAGTFHIESNGVDITGPLTVPDTGGWQTWTTLRRTAVPLQAGAQVLRAVMDSSGPNGTVGNINWIRVSPAATSGSGKDIILYASSVTTIAGRWNRVPSWSGAGGEKMQSAEEGWSTTEAPLASPSDYFEAEFVPEMNRAYRIWLRLRGGGDSLSSDSVWVQFSGSVDSDGAPLYRIGSTAALLVNLAACSDCGISFWGWRNTTWWLDQQNTVVRFTSSAPQRIRIQTREDGVEVDQIVLSPVTYFNEAPGSVRDDSVVVPMAQSGAVSLPGVVMFTASANHDSVVTNYLLRVFSEAAAAGPVPTASSDLGKPAVDQHGEISVDRTGFFSALPPGEYVVTVTAVGLWGETASDAVPFIR